MPLFAKTFCIALLLAALPMAAPAQTHAGPAPQWIVDESGYYCALATKVTGPPDATFVLRTLPGTRTYDMMLVGDRWPPKITGARKQIAFALLPGSAAESRSPETALLDRDRMISLQGLGGQLLDELPQSTALEVRADGKPVVRYGLPANAARASQALARPMGMAAPGGSPAPVPRLCFPMTGACRLTSA